MSETNQRMRRLYQGLTPGERAAQILQAWYADREEEPLLLQAMPPRERPALTALLRRVAAVNIYAVVFARTLEERADTLRAGFGWLEALRLWATATGQLVRIARRALATETDDPRRGRLLAWAEEEANLAPRTFALDRPLPRTEDELATEMDGAAFAVLAAVEAGTRALSRDVSMIEAWLAEVESELGGADPAVPGLREHLDAARAVTLEVAGALTEMGVAVELGEPTDDELADWRELQRQILTRHGI